MFRPIVKTSRSAWGTVFMVFVAMMTSMFVVVVMPQTAQAGTDDYPSQWAAPHAQDSLVDSWGEYNRECTSFAAWRLSSRNAFTMPFHDFAMGWGADATARGFSVNMNPAIGSVIWWNANHGIARQYGHVGWVESVSGTTVTYEDYNSDGTGHWGEHSITSSAPSGYIHFKDLSTSYRSGSDVDKNLGSDLVVTTNQPGGGSAANVGLSTYVGFIPPTQWWADPTVGWSGITPLVGDVNGDGKADYVFVANNSPTGVRVYVALSNGSTFGAPQLWWDGVGYGYSGIKASLGDVDGNGGADLILTTNQPGGGSAAVALLSTYVSFLPPQQWWADPTVGWSGITPLVGDLNGDGKADFVFVADNSPTGTRAYVALSTGSTFGGPQLWWDGVGYGYSGIKPVLGDVDHNGGADLVLVTNQAGGGSAAVVLLSTYVSFIGPQQWWADPTVGWSGITPLVGDLNGDGKADFVFVADAGVAGTKAYAALSTGSTFGGPTLWWNGSTYGYSGIKVALS